MGFPLSPNFFLKNALQFWAWFWKNPFCIIQSITLGFCWDFTKAYLVQILHCIFYGKKSFDDNRNLKYEFYIFSHQKDILFGHLSNKSRLQIMNIFISWGLTTIVYAIFLSFQLHTKASYATSSNIAVVIRLLSWGFSCITIWRLIFYL